jgi:aconitate hydratase
MAANIDMIRRVFEGYRDKLTHANTVLNRPMTYAEKILYTHLWEFRQQFIVII